MPIKLDSIAILEAICLSWTILQEDDCHETQISTRKTAGLLPKPVHFTAKGPMGPFGIPGDPS